MASNRKFMSALNALCEEKGIEKENEKWYIKNSNKKSEKENKISNNAQKVQGDKNRRNSRCRIF